MGALLLDRCADCGRCRLPAYGLETCPWCGSAASTSVPAGGDGTIYSYVVVRWPLAGPRAEHVDHVIATVELAEGARVLCRGVPGPAVAIGVPVRVVVASSDGAFGFDVVAAAAVPTAVAGA